MNQYLINNLVFLQVMSPACKIMTHHLIPLMIRKSSRHRCLPKATIGRKGGEKVGVGWPAYLLPFPLLYTQKNLSREEKSPAKQTPESPSWTSCQTKKCSFNEAKLSDRCETQNKPLIVFNNSADNPRWKSYAMSELRQQGCKWTVTGRQWPTIESIRKKLIEKEFTNAQLTAQILINTLMHDKEKYDLAMSKSAGIFSKLVSDQHQPIIEGKTPEEAWNNLQGRFQHINPMSTSRLIYNAITKKLADFKDVHKYTSSYQAAFDKVVGLLTDTSHSLYQKKHGNVLPGHNANEYRNRILRPRIGNSKRLKRQDNKPGRDGATNHQTFRIHGRKREERQSSSPNFNVKTSPCSTQRIV